VTGGSIGEELEVHAGGTLNIVNGNIARFGRALGGTVNMTGGTLGQFEVLAGATFTVSGGVVESDLYARDGSTVNIAGGLVSPTFDAGSEVHISGGRLAIFSDARDGSHVVVTGGDLGFGFYAYANANVQVFGGTFGDALTASGSSLEYHGFDFELDGVPVAGLVNEGDTVSVTAGEKLFTGTLADGTPFAFLATGEDDYRFASLRLERSATPPTVPVIDITGGTGPLGARNGQTLTLHNGGSLPSNFNAGRGSTVNILGGTVGQNFEAYVAVVNVEGGDIADGLDAFAGSEINVRGGHVGRDFDAYAGSVVNVSGGNMDRIDARTNSTVNLIAEVQTDNLANINVSGGRLAFLNGTSAGAIRWDGGVIERMSLTVPSTTLTVYGIGFKSGGVAIPGLVNEGDSVLFNVNNQTIVTGVLAKGNPLMLVPSFANGGIQIANGVLRLVRSAAVPVVPETIHVTAGNGPSFAGVGDTVIVEALGQLPDNFQAGPQSTVQILSGTIGDGFRATDAIVQVSGGNIGSGFMMMPGAQATITGGTFESGLIVLTGANVDIYGTNFRFNFRPFPSLPGPGSSTVLGPLNGTLTATLADGTPFTWPQLQSSIFAGSIVRLHVVPEPAGLTMIAGIAFALVLQRSRRGGGGKMTSTTIRLEEVTKDEDLSGFIL
jgi:hypothetical protein